MPPCAKTVDFVSGSSFHFNQNMIVFPTCQKEPEKTYRNSGYTGNSRPSKALTTPARFPLYSPIMSSAPLLPSFSANYLRGGRATGTSRGARSETVALSSGNVLQVAHAAGTSGLSPLGLFAPVVLPGLSGWVSA